MFAAGEQRWHYSTSSIGVHSASSLDGSPESTESMPVTTWTARLLKEYGMPASVIGRMVTTPGDQITYLTEADLAGFSTRVDAVGTAYAAPDNPAPSKPSPTGWAMSCTSSATGNSYAVWMSDAGIEVGKHGYSVGEQHFSKTGALVVSGKTHINTGYAAVFGGPNPRVKYWDGKTQAVDYCR
jgi:hypothetical protein